MTTTRSPLGSDLPVSFADQPAFRVARLLVAETYDLGEPSAGHGMVNPRQSIDHATLLRRRALAVPSQLVQHARHTECSGRDVTQAVDRLRREIEKARTDGYLGQNRYRRLQQLGEELERSTRVS